MLLELSLTQDAHGVHRNFPPSMLPYRGCTQHRTSAGGGNHRMVCPPLPPGNSQRRMTSISESRYTLDLQLHLRRAAYCTSNGQTGCSRLERCSNRHMKMMASQQYVRHKRYDQSKSHKKVVKALHETVPARPGRGKNIYLGID